MRPLKRAYEKGLQDKVNDVIRRTYIFLIKAAR